MNSAYLCLLAAASGAAQGHRVATISNYNSLFGIALYNPASATTVSRTSSTLFIGGVSFCAYFCAWRSICPVDASCAARFVDNCRFLRIRAPYRLGERTTGTKERGWKRCSRNSRIRSDPPTAAFKQPFFNPRLFSTTMLKRSELRQNRYARMGRTSRATPRFPRVVTGVSRSRRCSSSSLKNLEAGLVPGG
jgi:hypothetical protein